MSLFNARALALAGMFAALTGAVVLAESDANNAAKATEDSYPLKTCVVSGEPLGEMDEVKVIHYEGREVRLCCEDCEKPFRKNPEKYLKKLDKAAAAAAATQPSTQPSESDQAESEEG